MLTKSSGSFDKILKTAYYEYNINILNNKKQTKKTNKNSFLKKSENINKNKSKDNSVSKMDTKFLIDTADFINQNLKEITGGESTQDKKSIVI